MELDADRLAAAVKVPNVLPAAPQASSPFWWLWERFTDVHTVAYKASHGRHRRHLRKGTGRRWSSPSDARAASGEPIRCSPPRTARTSWSSPRRAASTGIPAWYHNLMANPETTVNWYGEVRRMRARETEGAERERLWKQMVDTYPTYEDYQRRTDRQIPVILLEPA